MKKLLQSVLVLGLVGGGGYLAWRFSPLGRKTLSRWLLNRWTALAAKRNHPLNRSYLALQLTKLDYNELETLTLLTRLDPLAGPPDAARDQRFLTYLQRLKAWGVFDRADLHSLENLVLPG